MMTLLGLLWGMSLTFLKKHSNGDSSKSYVWLGCIVGPLGVLIRFYLAKLDGQGLGRSEIMKWMPFGTLIANVAASCIMAAFATMMKAEDFLLLFLKHISMKFPREKKSKAGKIVTEKRISSSLNSCTSTTLLAGGKDLVLCGSALSSEEKYSLVDFGRSSGAVVSKYWRNNVTHVIAATDSNGACTRTLKVLMAILNGKWIVTTQWVKACIEAGRLVDAEPYEVTLDTHGCSGGPKAGRLRVLNNGPQLFNNLNFYFIGDFVKAFKNDLLNLVTTAGGTISEAKDQLRSSSNAAGDVKANQVTLVVYNADLSDHYEFEGEESIKFQRLAAAEDVAQEYGSRVVGHTWILESVAACSLLPFTSRS